MIGLVRAAALCATLALGLSLGGRRRPTRPSNVTISPIPRSSSRPRSRARPAPSPRPAPRCKTDADAAFKRNDFRTGLQILGQIAATTPEDSELAAARPHHLPDQPRQSPANRPS